MQTKTMKKIIAILIITFAIIITSAHAFAVITPDQINGEGQEDIEGLEFLDKITGGIRTVGTLIAVGALMFIGIRYVFGSIEEKANYKKSMIPYVIGCLVLFGASAVAPQFGELCENFKTKTDTTAIGNIVLGIIQLIGSFAAVGTIMVLGIKYVTGTIEERASYKKSMIPYIVGCVLIFGAVNITAVLYENFNQETRS